MLLPGICGYPAFVHQTPQISISADVIKSMIVNASVADMRGHMLERALAAHLQKGGVSRRVELQEGRSKLKSLGPLSPTSRSVTAFHCKNRSSCRWNPAILQPPYFVRREFKKSVELRLQHRGRQDWIDLYHQVLKPKVD